MLTRMHLGLRLILLTALWTLAGVMGGFLLGRAMLQRSAKVGLSIYAEQIRHNADDLDDDLNSIFRRFDVPSPSECSDHDLSEMQAETFRSGYVKDIGRTHNGKVYCSAFLGRLAEPHYQGPPALYLGNGTHIYTNIPLVLASMGAEHGTIVESSGTNVVLDPTSFAHWDRPYINYMIAAINRDTGQVVRMAGSALDVDANFVLSEGSENLRGTLYRSVCSNRNPVCVVTSERDVDVWRGTRSTQSAYSAMGGFAGLSLGLAMIAFYRRSTNVSHQLLRAIRSMSPSLYLVYQPIVDVHSGYCTGAEALVRWTDQNGVAISPDVFVSIAEEKGFIGELTAFVVCTATRDLGDLLRRREDFCLSVNVAASDIGGVQLMEVLDRHVSLAGIRPRQIALELTERSTAEVAVVKAAISRLAAQGYKVHIDDFGTGFSSLSYLDQLRVNAIKIDRAFTRTIGTDSMIAPILWQMLEMASALGVEVIVEGVETAAQRNYLAAFHKSLRAQGWYYSKPLTAEGIQAFHMEHQLSAETSGDSSQIETSSTCDYPVFATEEEAAKEVEEVVEVLDVQRGVWHS